MSTPQRNPGGYHGGCVMSHVEPALRRPGGLGGGRLLLVHGLIDENVHVRHSWRLVSEASRAGLPYELLVFPGERHVPR
jgi:dipeptidyl-peptidase 4